MAVLQSLALRKFNRCIVITSDNTEYDMLALNVVFVDSHLTEASLKSQQFWEAELY